MNNIDIPYFEDEDSKLIPDAPIVERAVINAVIYDQQRNEVLCLAWNNFDWKTFIIGGIENRESPVEAATREIQEETGYSNIRYMADLGRSRWGYYAAHKKENRISHAVGLLFELADKTQNSIPADEAAQHTPVWIPKDSVSSFINLASQKYTWEQAVKFLSALGVS